MLFKKALEQKMSTPEISITTAYYNRRKLFYRTLKSIEKSSFKDFELIVTDDASDEEERIEDFQDEFSFLKVIRVEKKDKWYINPCIPFNLAIRAATGKIVVLQNPECFHIGDVLTHIADTIQENDYLTYGCYSLDRDRTQRLENLNYDLEPKLFFEFVSWLLSPLPQRIVPVGGQLGWYNHSIYRPYALHFFSTLLRRHMDDLGGFDERYAEGIGYDDNELLIRIRRKGLNVRIIDQPYVLHQWHSSSPIKNSIHLANKNKDLVNMKTLKEKTWRVNEEKT